MIITKTPYRIPLSGGGTDLEFYYKKFNGHLISVAINQYIYVCFSERKIDENYLIQTTSTEFSERLTNIKNSLIRETLKYYNIKEKVYVGTFSTIPTRTGLGTSSAMVIGLINCIVKFKNLKISSKKIVQDAFVIERKICKIYGGWQDQIISQYGGLVDIKISKKEKLMIKKLKINKNIENVIKNNFLLVYTKIKRQSSQIILSQYKQKNINYLYSKIKELNSPIYNSIKVKDINKIGQIFNYHWNLKKKLSRKITDPQINKLYNQLIKKFNIVGGKLIGAGGGGFILVCIENKSKLIKILKKNKINFLEFEVERKGCGLLEFRK